VGLTLPSRTVQGAVDRYVARRAAGAAASARSAGERASLEKFAEAQARAMALEDARYATSFGGAAGLEGKLGVAVEALATGLSRTVSLSYPGYAGTWDSHADNDARQRPLWEELFGGLITLRQLLASTAGPTGRMLADDVVVLVVSEMGRTPALNGDNGKDHWPYTSALLWGPGIAGDRQVGGFDDTFQGRPVDLDGGGFSDAGVVPTASHLGATLLTTMDLDPAEHLPGYGPIGAILD
jgi:uncharacterized protein (DUF1501 family)